MGEIEDIREPLPCIVCGTQLQRAFKAVDSYSETFNQPFGGTAFRSDGNYGSTVYDETHGRFIEIIVCDDCLTTAGTQGRVVERLFIESPQEIFRQKWDIVAKRKIESSEDDV